MNYFSVPVEGEYFVIYTIQLHEKWHLSQVCQVTQRTGKRITEMTTTHSYVQVDLFCQFHTKVKFVFANSRCSREYNNYKKKSRFRVFFLCTVLLQICQSQFWELLLKLSKSIRCVPHSSYCTQRRDCRVVHCLSVE